MDWTPLLISAVSGGAISTIAIEVVRHFLGRKKEGIENESLAIEALKSTISELRLDNQRKDEIMSQYLLEREQFRLEREEKAEENATVKNGLCVHWGCVLRHPGIGRGDSWYQDHKDSPALGGDFLPINQLMKNYGQQKKKSEAMENSKEGEK